MFAEPCERHDLVAVRTDDSERTIAAVGKDLWKLLSQGKKLACQGEFDAAIWPCARKRTPIRRLADRVERGCSRWALLAIVQALHDAFHLPMCEFYMQLCSVADSTT